LTLPPRKQLPAVVDERLDPLIARTLKSLLRGNGGCGPGVELQATCALRAGSRVPSVIS
jgi:hypothetical protein